jgi:tRNA(Ile)-lysidine synthase TilS/MesJ
MQCNKCRNEPVIFQPYSGRHLCREHAILDIESRIKRDIRAGRWMKPGDHLAIALSGNKSSRALLCFFHKLTARRRDIRLSAIVIDEGIAGHRDVPALVAMAENLGIPCHLGSFGKDFLLGTGDAGHDGGSGSTCTRCRQLRHALIGTIARREGVTRIFSGRTLEDKATGILANILLGRVENLLPESGRKITVPWVDPLGSVPRTEADLYADFLCPGIEIPRCPYRETGFSDEVRDMMETYTERHPATPYSLLVIGEALHGECPPPCNSKEAPSHAA